MRCRKERIITTKDITKYRSRCFICNHPIVFKSKRHAGLLQDAKEI